jgi:nucleotide-binding universal stress UspA family protein
MMPAKTIVAGTDGSEESLRAVEWAARETALREAALRIVSVPVTWPYAGPRGKFSQVIAPELVAEVERQDAERALADAAKRAAWLAPALRVDTAIIDGPPAQALLDAASDASLLVVGSRGAGGFAGMMLGSVSRYVATHAHCPVVVARQETMAAHREIVVGVRDLEQSGAGLEFAFEEAALRGARLLAVHAWFWFVPGLQRVGALAGGQHPTIDPHEVSADAAVRLDATLAPWRSKYPGVQTGWEVVHAHPARVLAGAAARADLVVLGRHREGSTVGSVTHAVLAHAHGPVAVVPGD